MSRMPKTAEFTNPYTEVDIAPVQIPGVEFHNKIAVRVKDDGGEYQLAGTLSKDYNLIKNQIANETALDIFSRSNYKFDTLKVNFDGKKYFHYFKSVEPIVEQDDIKLHIGALIRNSYDGSSIFAMEIFGLNPFCTNQYHQRNQFGFFEIRHTGEHKFDINDALKNLSVGAQNLISIAPKIVAMKNLQLQIVDIKKAAEQTLIPKSAWGDVLATLEGATIFDLYQALTAYASHEINGLGSLHYGQLIGDHFLPVQGK